MKNTFRNKILLIVLCFIPFLSFAQITLVKDGKPKGRIIVDTSNENDVQAANLFQDFVERITKAKLPILNTQQKAFLPGDIIIGQFQLPVSGVDPNKITEDGFHILADKNAVHVIGSQVGKGSVYGIVTLLEDYFGVHYYSQDALEIPETKTLILPSGINRLENPSFRHRQTQAYSLRDSIYKLWHRLEFPNEVFASNLWVHTFDRIMPSAEFGESHPEYYSYINGERRPGAASQWCLTNPEVFEIVSQRIDSIFKANPGMNMISVSQNDGNGTYCACPECQAIDDREGSQSGTLIYFMNKLAERFPDKEFSTLAYLYSVPPPKHLKPLPNVNIMLCNIDCYREVPLTDNASGQSFMEAMEGWSKISNNIFVWDYGINFDNYVAPFPNFHILQPNMKLFKKNNVTMHFSQIASIKGGDFSELRSYLVAKLLWNNDVNTDSIIRSFINGYYGEAAAPYIYQYLKLREGALVGSNIPLWIYDTPITHKNGMLNKNMMKMYKQLFDQAEEAAKNDPIYLNRVRETRLPIQYSELEIARTEPQKDAQYLKGMLSQFKERAAEYNVVSLNERNNTVNEYVDLYIQRNLADLGKNLAYDAKVEYLIAPDPPYDKKGETAITDGLFGGATFNDGWVGWVGRDGEFIIDLREAKEIKRVETDFLHSLGAWILLPKSITCHTSTDKTNFTLLGSKEIAEDRSSQVKYVSIPIESSTPVKARYLKIKVETIGLCPSWHYGVGRPAWFFLDEVLVY